MLHSGWDAWEEPVKTCLGLNELRGSDFIWSIYLSRVTKIPPQEASGCQKKSPRDLFIIMQSVIFTEKIQANSNLNGSSEWVVI